MQSDSATLQHAWTQMANVRAQLNDYDKAHSALRTAALQCAPYFKHHMKKHFNTHAALCAWMLSFNNELDIKSPTKCNAAWKWFINEYAPPFLRKWYPSLCVVNIMFDLETQVRNYRDRDEWAERIVTHAPTAAEKQRLPVAHWKIYRDDAPHLAEAARALLSVVASEAACERSFSAQKLAHSAQKNRMTNDTVIATMRIRMNTRALQFAKEDKTQRAARRWQRLVGSEMACEPDVEDLPVAEIMDDDDEEQEKSDTTADSDNDGDTLPDVGDADSVGDADDDAFGADDDAGINFVPTRVEIDERVLVSFIENNGLLQLRSAGKSLRFSDALENSLVQCLIAAGTTLNTSAAKKRVKNLLQKMTESHRAGSDVADDASTLY
jgi:hypothetical protein